MTANDSCQEDGNFKSIDTVFKECVASMCVSSYPCGKGSWRPFDRDGKDWALYIADYNSDIPENGAANERIEELEHLIASEIYKTDDSWSKQVITFREMAIRNPDLVTPIYIKQHIKTLDLSGREITNVNESLKDFKQLQRLSLTGNSLKEFQSHLLPQSITELEISGNKIKDINAMLAHKLINLQYLGLSHNSIDGVSSLTLGEIWPRLVVLDLSFNAIEDLYNIIQPVKQLKTLRSLCLIGNPIMLCKIYRGYIIDSLPWLKVLDDSNVLVSERLKSSGLGQNQGKETEEVELEFEITTLNAQAEVFPDMIEITAQTTIIKRHIEIEYSMHLDTTKDRWNINNVHHTEERNQSDVELIQFSHKNIIKIDTAKCAKLAIVNNLHLRIVCHDIEYGTEPLKQETHHAEENHTQDNKGETHEQVSLKQKPVQEGRKSAVPKHIDNKQQKKGKDKKDESQLYEWSRTTNVIRTTIVPLHELLQGTRFIECVCQFEMDNNTGHTNGTQTINTDITVSQTSASHHSIEKQTKNEANTTNAQIPSLPEKKQSLLDPHNKNGKFNKKQKGNTSSHNLQSEDHILQEIFNPTLSIKLKLITNTS